MFRLIPSPLRRNEIKNTLRPCAFAVNKSTLRFSRKLYTKMPSLIKILIFKYSNW